MYPVVGYLPDRAIIILPYRRHLVPSLVLAVGVPVEHVVREVDFPSG